MRKTALGRRMPDRLRVFLDANILFSAALKESSRFLQFWRMRNAVPMTSWYVADEAQRNCVNPPHAARLAALLEQTHIVSDAPAAMLPPGIELAAKDAPVLAAALLCGADYLITGDTKHFGKWMDIPIETHLGRLLIQEPGRFLDEHLDPL